MTMTSEYVTEPIGFKVIIGGSFASLGGWLSSLDWATIVGVSVMVIGLGIQVAGYFRSKAADKRDLEKHLAEMKILNQKMAELGIKK